MIRKTADNDTELCSAEATLDLSDFAKVIDNNSSAVVMGLADHISAENREGEWEGFLSDLENDFYDFWEASFLSKALIDLDMDLDEGDLYSDSYDHLWAMVKAYATSKLHDDFVDEENDEDDVLASIFLTFDGREITISFKAEAGEIK